MGGYVNGGSGSNKQQQMMIGGMSLLELIFSPPSVDDGDHYYNYEGGDAAGQAGSDKQKKYMTITGDGGEDAADIDRLIKDLETAQAEVVRCMNESSSLRSTKDKLQLRLDNLSIHMQEYQRACQFYEKQANTEGLPCWQFASLPLSVVSPPTSPSNAGTAAARNYHHQLGGYEEAQLQEVASTTIGSLKRLIEEKNRIIDRYERKMADVCLLSRKQSAVGKAEIDALTEKILRKVGR